MRTVQCCADKPPGISSSSSRDWNPSEAALLLTCCLLAAGSAVQHVESSFPSGGWSLGPPLQWKQGVLTTGPPGTSAVLLLAQSACGYIFWVLLLAAKNLPSCELPQKLNPGTRIQGQRVYLGGDPKMQQQEGAEVRMGGHAATKRKQVAL